MTRSMRRLLWLMQLISLASLLVWAIVDLRFEFLANWLVANAQSQNSAAGFIDQVGQVRAALFTAIMVSAALAMCLLLTDLLRSRSVGRFGPVCTMLSLTCLIAVWLGLLINLNAIAWQGKRAGLALDVAQLEAIKSPLVERWPTEDGHLPSLGPFMAYPFGKPTTLLLLQSPRVAGTAFFIAAVERSESGAIRLQLTGTEFDDWAEWHPPGSHPSSFVGGLGDPHDLVQQATLRDGWHLVRYQNSVTTRPR
ncbi:MAG: hypothetical protein AAFV88_16945 [Planctomycetota bacterium]